MRSYALFIFVIIVIIIVVSDTVSADPASHGSTHGIDIESAFGIGPAIALQPNPAAAKDPILRPVPICCTLRHINICCRRGYRSELCRMLLEWHSCMIWEVSD